MIGAQPAQRGVERARDRVRPAVQNPLAVPDVENALRRERDVFAPIRQRLPHEPLVRPAAIKRGGVEVGASEVERPIQHPSRLLLGGRPAISVRQVHAAKPDRRHGPRSKHPRR